jgi:hypothetical protein
MEIYNSTFKNNTADVYGDGNGFGLGQGGAIFAGSANVGIYDSTFQSNTAPWGGAISAQFGTNVEIRNSIFQSNSADMKNARQGSGWFYNTGGGAMYGRGGSIFEIYNSEFIGNNAVYSGQVCTGVGVAGRSVIGKTCSVRSDCETGSFAGKCGTSVVSE